MTPVDNPVNNSNSADLRGTIGAQNKSGPDGAGNTVCSGPNPYRGGAMGKPTQLPPLTTADRIQIIGSVTNVANKSDQYKLQIIWNALHLSTWEQFFQAQAAAHRAEGARVLGRTPDSCHTIALAPWHACDVCGATGEVDI